MKLATILYAHRKTSQTPKALPEVLGDGYLLQYNSVYRQIRNQALKRKIKFSRDRFYHYDALPLTQLPRIHQKNTVPLLDNVAPLKEIESKQPEVFSLSDIPQLRENTILHESAHLIAHHELKIFAASRAENARVLLILVEEAFANACECLANLDAEQDVHRALHNEFLFKNCYIMEPHKNRKILKAAAELCGREIVFQLLFFSYLSANFLKTEISKRDEGRIYGILYRKQLSLLPSPRSESSQILSQVLKIGLSLDPQFTHFTNSFCLRLKGFATPLEDLLDFDFLKYFETKGKFQSLLTKFLTILTDPK